MTWNRKHITILRQPENWGTIRVENREGRLPLSTRQRKVHTFLAKKEKMLLQVIERLSKAA